MAAPVLSLVSPSFGPPGTAITLTGSGFDAGARVACPAVVPTTRVSATELRAAVPAEMPFATNTAIAVWVINGDGLASAGILFTVMVPLAAGAAQAYTTVDAVAGEVPGFQRGAAISDKQIAQWCRSIAEAIRGAMLRRGLPVDPAGWAATGTAGAPNPVELLEHMNRMGAAARLSAAVGAMFSSGDLAITRSFQTEYDRYLKGLRDGEYDHLFRAGAATVESGPQLAAGDMTDESGAADEPAFRKGKVF